MFSKSFSIFFFDIQWISTYQWTLYDIINNASLRFADEVKWPLKLLLLIEKYRVDEISSNECLSIVSMCCFEIHLFWMRKHHAAASRRSICILNHTRDSRWVSITSSNWLISTTNNQKTQLNDNSYNQSDDGRQVESMRYLKIWLSGSCQKESRRWWEIRSSDNCQMKPSSYWEIGRLGTNALDIELHEMRKIDKYTENVKNDYFLRLYLRNTLLYEQDRQRE